MAGQARFDIKRRLNGKVDATLYSPNGFPLMTSQPVDRPQQALAAVERIRDAVAGASQVDLSGE